MQEPSIVHSNTSVSLRPAPINPDWILEGKPVARNALLSRSHDGTASTFIWDCTAGTFDWHYDIDETVHVLEGSVVVSENNAPERRLGPGDVAFFPAGSHARWHVETYVRKIAFCRRTLPKPIELLVRTARRVRAMSPAHRRPESMLGASLSP